MPNLNPAMLVMQALGAGQPLNNILGNLAGQGAQYAKAVELIKGKDAQQLQTMAQNMAKERGIDLGDLMPRSRYQQITTNTSKYQQITLPFSV